MNSATVDILLYHDIARNEEEAKRLSNPLFTTPLPRFRAHLEWLKRSSYKLIRLNEWLDARKNGEVWEGKHVLLTFDGPHTGWFEYVLPLLVEMEIPATFFVIAGWVEKQHAFPESRHLTWNDIVSIEKVLDEGGRQLFDVGSHSMWHTTLDRRGGEGEAAYKGRLKEEIANATNLIRERTGLAVRSYATPKGKGRLDILRPMFETVDVEAVRWASAAGVRNHYLNGLYDLQISYCDTTTQTGDQLNITLSPTWLNLLKRARRRLAAEVRNRLG